MSMMDDFVWDANENAELCENNSKRVEEYARISPRGHWSFLGPGSEKSGTELTMAYQVDFRIERRRKCC